MSGPVSAAYTVGVVITTFNHAHFLDEALTSIMRQTRPADVVLVVDDGSWDNPASVVARFPGVQIVRQDNRGLSAARNRGLKDLSTDFVLFLDADDRLIARALASLTRCLESEPSAAYAYGSHQTIGSEGQPTSEIRYTAAGPDMYTALLHHNVVEMHGTVLYRREILTSYGGFDESLRKCEDYDVLLKLAQDHTVVSTSDLIAEYRWHTNNMSYDYRGMLSAALTVHGRHKPGRNAPLKLQTAWTDGRRFWRNYYHSLAWSAFRAEKSLHQFATYARIDLRETVNKLTFVIVRRLQSQLSRSLRRNGNELARPKVGRVRFGDLGGTRPIDDDFGFARGQPIDRFYVERFLKAHFANIRGRVLEIGDDAYSRRFGSGRITHQDVLHVSKSGPGITITGDLCNTGILPKDVFDCIIFTQTLHLIFDMQTALGNLHASLKSGGVMLITVPWISRIDRGEWGSNWFYSLTPAALRRLLSQVSPDGTVEVAAYGNVYAATAFLQGLAVADVDAAKLADHDPMVPLLVVGRIQRA